jgi:hypothetical protein
LAERKLKLSRADKAKLVAFYKDAIEKIMQSIDTNVWNNPSNARLVILLQDTRNIIKDLDRKVARWVDSEVASLYGGNIVFINDSIKAFVPIPSTTMGAAIHTTAINNLVLNPTYGITPRLKAASAKLNQSIESFVMQNKVLKRQAQMVSTSLAEGLLLGRSAAETRNQILDSLLNKKPGSFLGLDPAVSGARSLIDAPYLRVPLKNGGSRRLHIFDHVQMTAATMESRVRTEARKNQLISADIRLAQISPNPPLTPCACALFAGRIVSLDAESEKATGYPYIGRLPNGGPPFHPYCTHTILPWLPDMEDKEDIDDAHESKESVPTFGGKGLPQALIDKDWSSATRYFKSKGQIAWAARQNPIILKHAPSTMTDKSVLDDLKKAKAKP